jgi:hypothetical protein
MKRQLWTKASWFVVAMACAVGVAACDQPPEEAADQSNESAVSLPDCGSVCGVKKACATGCSVESGNQRIAETCQEYMAGSCDGKDDIKDPEDPMSPGGGGGGGPHACYDGWCKPSGTPKLVGGTVFYANVSSKAHPGRKPEKRWYGVYAQPQMTYRPEGAAACYPVRCACDRLFTSEGGRVGPSFQSWGVQYSNGTCRHY